MPRIDRAQLQALMPRLLASALSGVLLVFISAPANIHWMHWLSFVPMLWALRPGEDKLNGRIAWFGGWIAIFILYYWIIETIIRFSNVPWLLAFTAHLLFSTVFSLPYLLMGRAVHWLRARFNSAWTLALPAIWVTMEMLPTLFPYYHGVSQYRFMPTWQLVSVLGITSLTFLVWWSNAVAVETIWARQQGRPLPLKSLGGFIAVFLGNLIFGFWRIEQVESELEEAPVVKVALLQHNVTMDVRLREHPSVTTKAWVDSTRETLNDSPDLVIWPEGAILYNPDEERKAAWLNKQSPKEFFSSWTARYKFHLLIGGGTWEATEGPDGRRKVTSYNSAYAYNREGEIVGRYDKMIPLPFGEYIPGASLFPWLADQIEGVGNFQAGDIPTTFPATTGEGVEYTYSVPICYEAILNLPMWWLYEGTGDQPVDLFVVITNDAWFGDTSSPHQHAMLTTVPAMEFGRPVVRNAYTGVSWVVEPHGRIVGETGTFEDVATVEEVRLGSMSTPYVAGGWVFPYLCILGTVGVIAVGRRREGAPQAEPSSPEENEEAVEDPVSSPVGAPPLESPNRDSAVDA